MRRILTELNNFSEATTVHGFAYLSKGQRKSTKVIWSLIVTGAAIVAGYFLFNTIKGFDEKYTSTTIETRNIKDFPFPAVTFHPGDFNSENSFLRTYLNQFGFTRYEGSNNVRDNNMFRNKFGWLVKLTTREIFKHVQNYLLEENNFISQKGNIFKNEVCSLVALKVKTVNVQDAVMQIYEDNVYKLRGFRSILTFIKQNVTQELNSLKKQYNISNNEVSSICKDKEVKY